MILSRYTSLDVRKTCFVIYSEAFVSEFLENPEKRFQRSEINEGMDIKKTLMKQKVLTGDNIQYCHLCLIGRSLPVSI